jgi:methionyl-tRNA formyltransferase
MDTGPILCQRQLAIGPAETAAELTPRLAALGADLLLESLPAIANGELKPVTQNEAEVTLAPILKREDGQVDWSMTARQIENRRRGFTPFPGCYTLLAGQRLEIITGEPHEGESAGPAESANSAGTIIEVGRESFTVACGAGTRLSVTSVQPAGKRAMAVRDFLNGAKLKAGDRFDS